MLGLFGIEDTYIWLVYLLCIASAVLCVLYGLVNWNKGETPVKSEDVRWAEQEKKVEEEL